MIIICTYIDSEDGKEYIDYGISIDNNKIITLSPILLKTAIASGLIKFNHDLGEYVIYENKTI